MCCQVSFLLNIRLHAYVPQEFKVPFEVTDDGICKCVYPLQTVSRQCSSKFPELHIVCRRSLISGEKQRRQRVGSNFRCPVFMLICERRKTIIYVIVL